jgi:hypothetical protein
MKRERQSSAGGQIAFLEPVSIRISTIVVVAAELRNHQHESGRAEIV